MSKCNRCGATETASTLKIAVLEKQVTDLAAVLHSLVVRSIGISYHISFDSLADPKIALAHYKADIAGATAFKLEEALSDRATLYRRVAELEHACWINGWATSLNQNGP
jgi:hypothetical protein